GADRRPRTPTHRAAVVAVRRRGAAGVRGGGQVERRFPPAGVPRPDAVVGLGGAPLRRAPAPDPQPAAGRVPGAARLGRDRAGGLPGQLERLVRQRPGVPPVQPGGCPGRLLAGPAHRLGVEPDPLSPAVAGVRRRFGQCPPVRLTRVAVAAAGAPHRVPLGRGGGLRRRTLRLLRAAAGHSGVVVVVPARTRGAGVAGDRATGLAGRSDPGGGRCGNRPLVLLPRTGDVLLLRPPVRTTAGPVG